MAEVPRRDKRIMQQDTCFVITFFPLNALLASEFYEELFAKISYGRFTELYGLRLE